MQIIVPSNAKPRSEYVLWSSCNSKIHLSLHIIHHGFGVGRPCTLVARGNAEFTEEQSEKTLMSRYDKRFLDIMEKSMKHKDGHYLFPVPFTASSYSTIISSSKVLSICQATNT